MVQFKGGLSGLLLGLSLLNGVVGRKVNTTIYDTNTAHITYAPQKDFCVRWSKYLFWITCKGWAKPWESVVYRSQGKLVTLHRSLDHEQPTMTIKFQGSSIWLYGPPRSQLPATPVDHKICLYENHRVASDIVCYRVDVAEAYSVAEDYNAPVVIFAKGGLQDQEHQLVVSVGDPVDEVDKHRGVQFSHAVYTIERPTPWPTDEDSWRFREVVVHDTHPLLSYWPKEPVSASLWPWSPGPSGWFSKTHLAEDGSRVSWHELRAWGESNQDKWGMDITVIAGVVALYGVPKIHIAEIESLSNVCVQVDSGPCEIVDVKTTYLRVENHHEAVLLWRNQNLDPYQQTRISIRLVKMGGNNLKVFPFQAIHYFEQQEYSSPDPPVGQLEDVAVVHDDHAIVYYPGRRCLNYVAWWCAEWFDPWAWKEAGPSGSVLTYRSTVSSYRAAEDPSITLNFQGSAVYVYGAPKSFMKDGFASQHICINNACHVVDVEQAYLNAPEVHMELASAHPLQTLDTSNLTTLSTIHPELDPVLIWSMTGLDDKIQHSLRLALAELPSPENAEMSIAKVVYTKVTYGPGQSRPDTPVPPDHTDEGPLYPPHAIEWAPRLPSPHPAQPHRPSPGPSKLPYVLGTLVFFSICVFLVISQNSTETPERRPIRPITPPPPYVPSPLPRPRPTPRVVRPNPPPVRPNPPPVRPNPPRPNPPPYRPSPPAVPPNVAPFPVQPIQQDRNNIGPCPGFNVALPKPEYTDSVQKQPSTLSQKPQTAASSAITSTQRHTGPVHNIASSSQAHSTAQQPPPIARPAPQLPSQASHTSQNTSATQARVRSDDTTLRSGQVIQSTPSKATPSTQTNPQAVLNPVQPPVIPRNGHPSATTTSRPQVPVPNPQEAYTPSPAFAQWAEGQGYRIDRLMNPASRNENTRQRISAERNQAQGRSAMPPFDPAAHDTLGRGSADWRAWRRNVEETGRIPLTNAQPNQGAVSGNRREQGRGEPEGNQRVAPIRNNAGVNSDSNRMRAEGTRVGRGEDGGEAPAAVGAGARRSRANKQRPSQATNNNRQR